MIGVDAVAEILKREGTEFLACYPAQRMIDAAAKLDITPILCRQERMGMAIADGFSRITSGSRIGVFAMQHGPGAENAFPGAAQAFSENVPVLIIPGAEATTRSFVEPNFSSVENYRNVTKWRAEVNHVERIPELMRRAFYQLRTGKPGPVLVELPRDIWDAELEGELDYVPVRGNLVRPDSDEIREVASVLLKAEHPVIHAGQGCLYTDTWNELQEIAELLQAPVMTTMQGKSCFPENHPLSLGSSAVSTTKAVHQFVSNSDLIFGIGCSFTKTNYGKAIPSGKIIVHSTNDANDINKDIAADYALLGDAKLVLTDLISQIKVQSGDAGHTKTRNIGPEVQRLKREWLGEWMPRLTSDETPINQYRIIWDLMNNVDRANTIVTHDAGSPRDQIVPFWECVAPRTYMGWGKSTQLGYGLGITMGAKLAEPDKLCVNMMGDAAIGMVGMDIETAVRNKIGILTIVFNNGMMSIEHDHMPYSAQSHDTLSVGGDYRKVAEGLGAWSLRVEKPDDFLPALDQAIQITKTGQPALLDCICKDNIEFSKYP